jgi:hypothetical protein
MDQLDNVTLRRLQEFVRSVVHPKSKHKRPPSSAAAQPRPSITPAVPVGLTTGIIHDSDDDGNDTDSSSSFDSDLSSDDEAKAPSDVKGGKAPAGSNQGRDVHVENTAAWSALENSSAKDGSELWKDLKNVAGDSHNDVHGNGGVLEEQQIREMDEERQRQMQQLAQANNSADEMEEVEDYANLAG